MTKLIKLITINEQVEKYYKEAVVKKNDLNVLNQKKEKLLIIQKSAYKSLFNYIKEYVNGVELNKKIQDTELDYEELIAKICNIRNTDCKHDILLLIKKYKNEEQEILECLCPVCGAKYIMSNFDKKLRIIDETMNPNKDKFFGPVRELEIDYLTKIKKLYLRNDEATVDDFFDFYFKEENEKIKVKTLV